MRIEVTQEDIDNGKRMNPNKCPIARAISRATKGVASTGGYTTTVFHTPKWFGLKKITLYGVLPKIAQTFIWMYDSREPVEPFSFDIDLVKWS